MRDFLDAIADAHLVPHHDGTVRFALGRPESNYVTLSETEAETLRPLWRSLVRCHVLGAHVFALVGIFAPWTGLLFLLAQWCGGSFLVQDFKRRSGSKAAAEEGHFRKVRLALTRHVSRRNAALLGVAFLLIAALGIWAESPLQSVLPDPTGSLDCLQILALRWMLFFLGIAIFSEP